MIAKDYEIVNHQPDTDSGFSATLFQKVERDKDGQVISRGEYILALRGTAGMSDYATDVGDIVLDGIGFDQIVDLYNFWQRITTEKDQHYKQAILKIDENLTDEYKSKLKKYNILMASDLQDPQMLDFAFQELDEVKRKVADDGYVIDGSTVKKIEFVDTPVCNDIPNIGLGFDITSVTVAGHSLGGHLAAAFARLFQALPQQLGW